jgi:hypothetical protein
MKGVRMARGCARQGGRSRVRGAHTAQGAYMEKEHMWLRGRVQQRGHGRDPGADGNGNAHGNARHAWPRGMYARASNDGPRPHTMKLAWAHMYAPIIGGAYEGLARLQGGKYICHTFLI